MTGDNKKDPHGVEESRYRMPIERRKHPRAPMTYITRYKLRYIGTTYAINHTKNISQGGALLFTNRVLKKGEQLEMYIRFPFAEKEIKVIAEVVGSEEVKKNLVYQSRLKFIEMNEEARKKLGELIDRRKNMNEL